MQPNQRLKDSKCLFPPFKKGGVKNFRQTLCLAPHPVFKYMILPLVLRGWMRILKKNNKVFFTFQFSVATWQNCLMLSFMFYIMYQILYLFLQLRNSGIYTKFTTPRKQQTKVGMQGTESAAEPIDTDKCFGVCIDFSQIISDENYILFYLLFILGSGLTEAQIRRQEIELFQNIKEEYICGYRTGADQEVLGCRKLNYSRI